MKIILVASCLLALVYCAPSSDSYPLRHLPALKHEEVHDEFGQYALRYITAENTVVSEIGRLVPSQNGTYVLEIEGQYEFIGDDGKLYVTKYKAGKDGFQVKGSHLPQSVPVPDVPKQ